MNVLGRMALLFVLVPIVELMLLVKLGEAVGLFPTLALVVFTGLGGAMLARAEGVRVLFQFQREVARGRIPGQAMLDGLSVVVGGAFLLTPGVLTDVVGLLLLFPLSRRWIQRRVRRRLERQIADGAIRVVTMGPGGLGGFGFGARGSHGSTGVGSTGGAMDAAAKAAAQAGRDPSKGIVIEADD